MNQPCDSRETSSASDVEDASKVPSLQADGSSSVTDEEGWPACNSRSRCRRPKWTREEEMVLVEAHCTLGNAWVAIAECLPGRTPSEVKNIWHSTLRARKLQTRSVLRAYVTALKDRADKPAARQQAMRAAQHFLSEGSSKGCSPAKRGPKRSAVQQQLQQQQQRLPQLGAAADSPPPPAAGEATGALSEADLTACAPAPCRAAATLDARQGGVDAVACHAAAASSAAAAAAAAPVVHVSGTGHRSSLGSEWSCVSSSGALESWPAAAAVGGGARSGSTGGARSGSTGGARSGSTGGARSGSGGGALPASGPSGDPAVASVQVMSFSPLMPPAATAATASLSAASTYAQSHAAAARSSPNVITTSGAVSRYNSPCPRPDSPPLPVPPPHAAPRNAGDSGISADWRDAAGREQASFGGVVANNVATANFEAAGGAVAMDWMAPHAPRTYACSQAQRQQYQYQYQQQQHQHQQQNQERMDASWMSSSRGSAPGIASGQALAPRGETAPWEERTWGQARIAPAAEQQQPVRSGYVVSTGGSSSGGMWTEAGRYVAVAVPTPALGEERGAMLAAPAAAAGAGAADFKSSHNGPTIGTQLRGAAQSAQSTFGDVGAAGGGSVITMGLYGIMDEELLACLRA